MAEYLKLPEVAHRLGVSEKTARRYVKSGAIPSVFIGGAYRVSEADLEKFLESAKVDPGKVTAPPSQPDFNGLLQEERRRAQLGEIWEGYREERQGVEHYLERWERWLETGGIPEEAVREFLVAASAFYPVLRGLAINELTAISVVLDIEPAPYLPDEAKTESSILPLVDRYWELGRRFTEIWHERFPEEPPADLGARREEHLRRKVG